MSQWAIAVKQFGEQIGMPELVLSATGQFAMQMASGRRIAAEAVGDDFLVYASDPVPYEGPQRLLRAWRRAYLTRLDGRPVQMALRDQDGLMRLLAVVRLQTDECSVHTLHSAVNQVSSWLDDTLNH